MLDKTARMPARQLSDLLRALDEAGIEVWLDGGWGVDALLGRQTREHNDVDLILRLSDVPALRRALAGRGFGVKEGAPPNSFVLADGAGLDVDVHAVVFDDQGDGVYRMQNGEDWVYPSEGFSGTGSIEGLAVRCLTPEAQVLCHAHGYEPGEKDFRDMALLEERFELELPSRLRRGGHIPDPGNEQTT